MEKANTILSFEEFVKQGSTGGDMDHTEIGMTHDDIPAADAAEIDHDMTGDDAQISTVEPAPAVQPETGDSEHNVPINMIDSESGEAETTVEAEPNVQIEEPANSTEN